MQLLLCQYINRDSSDKTLNTLVLPPSIVRSGNGKSCGVGEGFARGRMRLKAEMSATEYLRTKQREDEDKQTRIAMTSCVAIKDL